MNFVMILSTMSEIFFLETLDDGCQHGHYYNFSDRLVDVEEGSDESFDLNPLEEKKGHPLPCSSGCCTSQLYTTAVHYPILRTLLNNIIVLGGVTVV